MVKCEARAIAIAEGKLTYSSGKPCRRGHTAERFVVNRCCAECQAINFKAWKEKTGGASKESKSESNRRYREKFPDKIKADKRAWNKGFLEKRRLYTEKNRARIRAVNKVWHKNNPAALRLSCAKRRALKKSSVPAWFSDFDKFVEQEAYLACDRRKELTGIQWQLDHMIPLAKGGLHEYRNFQVIPRQVNQFKGSKMIYTLPGEWLEFYRTDP